MWTCASCQQPTQGKGYLLTHDTARGALGFCFTEHLVAEALDVVHRVGNDDRGWRQVALDGRRKSGARILFASGSSIDVAVQSQVLVVQVVDLEFRDARIL